MPAPRTSGWSCCPTRATRPRWRPAWGRSHRLVEQGRAGARGAQPSCQGVAPRQRNACLSRCTRRAVVPKGKRASVMVILESSGPQRTTGTRQKSTTLARCGSRILISKARRCVEPAHSSSPPWRSATRTGSASLSRLWRDAWQIRASWLASATPRCATAGPGCFRPPGAWPAKPKTPSCLPRRGC